MGFLRDFIKPEMIGSAVRALMASFGGAVITDGWVTSEQWVTLTGAAVIIVTVLWSRFAKKAQGVI